MLDKCRLLDRWLYKLVRQRQSKLKAALYQGLAEGTTQDYLWHSHLWNQTPVPLLAGFLGQWQGSLDKGGVQILVLPPEL